MALGESGFPSFHSADSYALARLDTLPSTILGMMSLVFFSEPLRYLSEFSFWGHEEGSGLKACGGDVGEALLKEHRH